MSPSAANRTAGFSALLPFSGEPLTADKSKLVRQFVVNRKVAKVRDSVTMVDGAMPNFNVLGMTELECLKSAVSQPVAGDAWNDFDGFRHRIKYVTKTDITWVCYCVPSQIV